MSAPSFDVRQDKSTDITLSLHGEWTIDHPLPSLQSIVDRIGNPRAFKRFTVDCSTLESWDSLMLTALIRIKAHYTTFDIEFDETGLPSGARGMLALSRAVPERDDAERAKAPADLLETLGQRGAKLVSDLDGLTVFLGETCLAFTRLVLGRSQMRISDLWNLVQECGPNALPIISLIAILVGMILAFVGAVQLKLFGAQIFIADLVGLGMAREMGAMMTAILMAGRTGSAFAAELGSMTVNDEIDALKTSGFSPMDFLVVPRILAMTLTIPFLCVYADVLGILGGAIVAAGLFDISLSEYVIQIENRLRPIDFEVGVFKAAVFGVLVAFSGCMRGLQCKRNATAVGLATTSAVVTGIVFIVISDAVMTLIITELNVFKR